MKTSMALKTFRADHPRSMAAVILLFLFAVVAGCQTSGAVAIKSLKVSGTRIPLEAGGPHTGSFSTRDMTIVYQYQIRNEKLLVSGTLDFKYSNIDKLSMTLYYLDDHGTVIDYYRFFTRPQKAIRGMIMDNTFSREFDLVVDAKAFSIGYTGQTKINKGAGGRVFQYSPF